MFEQTFDSDYPRRNCTACGTENYCNMYGMHTCTNCGFRDRPHLDDNESRAREWKKQMTQGPLPTDDTDANTLIDEITTGEWDPYLQDIVNAISQRRSVRQEGVLSLVQEVFGPNATVRVTK